MVTLKTQQNLMFICVTGVAHTSEKIEAPAYTPGTFLEVLASRNAQRMLAFAEDAQHNHLDRWAMATAATPLDTDGSVAFWLAQRLIPDQVDSIYDPSLENGTDARKQLAQHYILQATRQKHAKACSLYYETYHAAPTESEDPTLDVFSKLLEREHEFKPIHFRKHADYYARDKKTLLRALALTMIGLHRTEKEDAGGIAIIAAAFANHRIPKSRGRYVGEMYTFDPCLALFKPTIKLALQYFPSSAVTGDDAIATILWYAEMCKDSKNVPEARRLSEMALPKINEDFRGSAWYIEKYLHETGPKPVTPPQDNNECVIL